MLIRVKIEKQMKKHGSWRLGQDVLKNMDFGVKDEIQENLRSKCKFFKKNEIFFIT